MTFEKTKLPGVFEIRIEPRPDERGFLRGAGVSGSLKTMA